MVVALGAGLFARRVRELPGKNIPVSKPHPRLLYKQAELAEMPVIFAGSS